MPYKVEYKASVIRDLRKLNQNIAKRLLTKLESELSKSADIGIPLKEAFQGLFRLRIGNYRVIYTKTKEGVLVLRIGHRSERKGFGE